MTNTQAEQTVAQGCILKGRKYTITSVTKISGSWKENEVAGFVAFYFSQ